MAKVVTFAPSAPTTSHVTPSSANRSIWKPVSESEVSVQPSTRLLRPTVLPHRSIGRLGRLASGGGGGGGSGSGSPGSGSGSGSDGPNRWLGPGLPRLMYQ